MKASPVRPDSGAHVRKIPVGQDRSCKTRKCLYHRVLVSGENLANRCHPEAPFWEVAESVTSLLTSN